MAEHYLAEEGHQLYRNPISIVSIPKRFCQFINTKASEGGGRVSMFSDALIRMQNGKERTRQLPDYNDDTSSKAYGSRRSSRGDERKGRFCFSRTDDKMRISSVQTYRHGTVCSVLCLRLVQFHLLLGDHGGHFGVFNANHGKKVLG